jgi:MYXO-CTERM domain-containing protein
MHLGSLVRRVALLVLGLSLAVLLLGCHSDPPPPDAPALRARFPAYAGGEGVLADPVWTTVGTMFTAREFHTATRLGDGKVLVAGGDNGMLNLASAELYDPATKIWMTTGAMGSTHQEHTATLLGNGKVLIAGGLTNTAALYDPLTQTWTPAASMSTARTIHTATLLGDGRVLVAGGYDVSSCLASAELYDPVSNTWTPTDSMSIPRCGHTATRLGDGRVLVAGGDDGIVASTNAQLYDPVSNLWTPAAPMNTARTVHTATLLGNGHVLVAGATDLIVASASVELYDLVSNAWAPAASMNAARVLHTATLLGSGHVLVAGGTDWTVTAASAELYDPVSKTWTLTASMSVGRYGHTATLLGNGQALVVGGQDGTQVVKSAELFAPLPTGAPCALPGECQSGFCADSVCCNTACNAGDCDACSMAAGAPSDGACAPLTGNACAGPCIQGGNCMAGVCMGTPVICIAPDACTDAYCDGTNQCAYSPKADSTPCDDGNVCTQNDTCQSGICKPGSATTCPALDACHLPGTCNPQTGCSSPAQPDGTKCDDANACTGGDTCQNGICAGAPIDCPWIDACHPGVCDPTTGLCSNLPDPNCGQGGPSVPGGSVQVCSDDTGCPLDHPHCVDHVCCTSTCKDPCFSCALPDSPGTCAHAPAGVDLRDDCGAAADCLSTCDGNGMCVGADAQTQCEPSRCTDASHGLGPATCKSHGTPCPIGERVPFDCGRFRCEPAFGACFTSCRSVAECAPGSVCEPPGKCVPPPSVASEQGTGCTCNLAKPRPQSPSAWWIVTGFVAAAVVRRRSSRGRHSFPWPLVGLSTLLLGCSAEPSSQKLDGSLLRSQFPEQAGAEAVLVDSTWTTTTMMNANRYDHTATLMGDGRVLVVGGYYGVGTNSTSELYDPVLHTWTLKMSNTRAVHTATLLGNGKVLVAGGDNSGVTLATSELYDPASDAWTGNMMMTTPRKAQTATLLGNGKVLVAGGRSGNTYLNSAELYDPISNAWSSIVAKMTAARQDHTATLLGNGKVLVAGGFDGNAPLQSAELYDPVLPSWTAIAPTTMSDARQGHTATRLSDGRVLVAGGYGNAGALASADLYDPATNTWTPAHSMSNTRDSHTATLLTNGWLLVTGGTNSSGPIDSAELYDPVNDQWSTTAPMSTSRFDHTATLLGDGKVLIAGGLIDMITVLKSAEIFDPLPLGAPCAQGSDCPFGFCADGVCCNTPCNADPCHACSIAAGAPADGKCAPLTGKACGGGPCMQGGTCQAGVCTGAIPMVCSAPDACTDAYCDPSTSMCMTQPRMEDSPCNTGNPCIIPGKCKGGACVGAVATICKAPDACHDASCNPMTGMCETSVKSGTPCDDGNPCTVDTCQGGVCQGASVVDSTPCQDPNLCTQPGTCQNGVCQAGPAKTCAPLDSCHDQGICDAKTGLCDYPLKSGCDPSLDGGPGPGVAPEDVHSCATDADCPGRVCSIDHVCCNEVCDQKCSSCVLPGSVGQCTQEPIGVDLRHECGPENTCIGTCDGQGMCIGAGKGTECAANRCTDESHGVGPTYCMSKDDVCHVETAVSFDCRGYRCEPIVGVCLTSCRSIADCAPGAVCNSELCVRPPDVAAGHAPSCGVAAPGANGSARAWVAALILAGVLGRRRRRSSAARVENRIPSGPQDLLAEKRAPSSFQEGGSNSRHVLPIFGCIVHDLEREGSGKP